MKTLRRITQARLAWLIAGTVVLSAYGILINLAQWDFGKVLGVYVVLFFLVAQIMNWIGFGIRPGPPIFVGGLSSAWAE